MNTENEPKDLHEELREQFASQREPEDPADDVATVEETTEPSEGRDEKGRFKQKEDPAVELAIEPKAPEVKAPDSWTPTSKAEWEKIPAPVRAEIAKREADMHQAMTRHDGDLRMGREIKEVIMPYLPAIQAEGGTPATAVRDLLNTAYVLRSADPARKAQMVKTIIEQYGVDMNLIGQQEYTDPTIAALQNEIANLKQTMNPDAMQKQLQQRMEQDRVTSEVQAFAADPANAHFETVRPLMKALLESGQYATLQEAYKAACLAHPTIGSTVQVKPKPVEDIAAKKRAAASITGSPGANVPNSTAPHQSLEDDLREQLRASRGKSI